MSVCTMKNSKKMATDSDTDTAVDAMWHASQSERWFVNHKDYWQWEWEWKWATEMYNNFTLRLLELMNNLQKTESKIITNGNNILLYVTTSSLTHIISLCCTVHTPSLAASLCHKHTDTLHPLY